MHFVKNMFTAVYYTYGLVLNMENKTDFSLVCLDTLKVKVT